LDDEVVDPIEMEAMGSGINDNSRMYNLAHDTLLLDEYGDSD